MNLNTQELVKSRSQAYAEAMLTGIELTNEHALGNLAVARTAVESADLENEIGIRNCQEISRLVALLPQAVECERSHVGIFPQGGPELIRPIQTSVIWARTRIRTRNSPAYDTPYKPFYIVGDNKSKKDRTLLLSSALYQGISTLNPSHKIRKAVDAQDELRFSQEPGEEIEADKTDNPDACTLNECMPGAISLTTGVFRNGYWPKGPVSCEEVEQFHVPEKLAVLAVQFGKVEEFDRVLLGQ